MNEENQTNEPEEITTNEAGQVKKLLEKNLALTEEIYKMVKKVKRYTNFQKVMSFIYFLLIVVPLILGVIFLPPLLSGVIKQYQDLLGTDTTGSVNDLLKSLPEGLRNQVKVLPK